MRGQGLPSPSVKCGLLEYLYTSLPGWKRVRVKELLQSGRVHVNGESARQFDLALKADDLIDIRERATPARRDLAFPVLFEDGHLIAIDKPIGLLSIGTRYEKVKTAYSVVNYELSKTGERAFVVHRLDRETSGVMLFAKSPAIKEIVMNRWGQAEKTYYALVEGVPSQERGRLVHYLREDEHLIMRAFDHPVAGSVKARLNWELVEVRDGFSLLRVNLETGKKNQIRCQLSAIGHTIAGDRKYGSTTDPLGRMCLHAARLKIPHPKLRNSVVLESPLPQGFLTRAT